MVRYIPIPQFTWPQDNLSVPHGFGDMPRVDPGNRHISKNEPFVYGNNAPFLVANGSQSMFIKIEPDADFWCDQIIMDIGTPVGASTPIQTSPVSQPLQIEDTRSGYKFVFGDGATDAFFNSNNINTLGGGGAPLAVTIVRMNATLMQPYCFTRNNAIKITTTPLMDQTLFMAFIGWKEYEYASR